MSRQSSESHATFSIVPPPPDCGTQPAIPLYSSPTLSCLPRFAAKLFAGTGALRIACTTSATVALPKMRAGSAATLASSLACVPLPPTSYEQTTLRMSPIPGIASRSAVWMQFSRCVLSIKYKALNSRGVGTHSQRAAAANNLLTGRLRPRVGRGVAQARAPTRIRAVWPR